MIDITRGVLNAPLYPGDPAPELTSEQSGEYRLSSLKFCLHTGTHVDAPLHYLEDGEPAEKLDVGRMNGRCLVTDGLPDLTDLQTMAREEIGILLLKGAFITSELLSLLDSLGVTAVGNDLISIAPPEDEREIHIALFERGIVPIECLKLDEANAGIYELTALPMLIEGAEAAPVRAFLQKIPTTDNQERGI